MNTSISLQAGLEEMPAELREQAERLHDFFGEEELLPELAKHLHSSDLGLPNLQHPLVYSVMHTPMLNRMTNRSLLAKKEAAAKAKADKKWSRYVYLHERPWRFNALQEVWGDIRRERDRASLFISLWTDAENLWQVRDIWEQLLDDLEPSSFRSAMRPGDLEVLESLRYPLTIYRGGDPDYQQGLSWTLDRHKAEWFAERFKHHEDDGVSPGELFAAQVEEDDILFYHGGRGESEIVITLEASERIHFA